MAAMSDRTIVVARRFRGPDAGPATGNGGYFCGLVAGAAPQATTIEIRAGAGVPLDRPLAVRVDAGAVEVLDDGALVARSSPARLAVHAPVPPPLEVALEASRRFEAQLDEGSVRHTFPECFVCGHRRAAGDGMRLFAGPLPGDGPERGQVRVAGWRPDPAFVDEAGRLRPEFVWSALDCPGGWALPGPINTGTLQVEIREPVDARHPLIVMGWRAPAPTPRAGSRRRYAGTAIFDAGGRLLALGAAIWVTPDPLAAGR
jgi:hypothetical protein